MDAAAIKKRKRGRDGQGKELSRQEEVIWYINVLLANFNNQSGAAEAWWAHNPQVPGSKPGSDRRVASTFPLASFLFNRSPVLFFIYN